MLGTLNDTVMTGSAPHQLAAPLDALGAQLFSLAASSDPFLYPPNPRQDGRNCTAAISAPTTGAEVEPFEKLNFNELKIDTGGYRCPICSLESRDKGLLRRHYRIHSGEKPYACLFCPYRANQNSSLKSHMIVQHGVL